MSLLNQVLEKAGVSYEDLNKAERDTLHQMLDSVQKNEITIERLRDYIQQMIGIVAEELSEMSMKRPSFWSFMFNFRRDYILKARLRNYMLLQAILDNPKRAKKAIEEALGSMGAKRANL